MEIDSDLRRQLDEATAECRALHVQLAELVRERDALLAEATRLRAAFEETAVEKARMTMRALDGIAAEVELAERQARRRQASSTKDPALMFAYAWILKAVRDGDCDAASPASLLTRLIHKAKEAGHQDFNPSLKWLSARVRTARAEVAFERQRAKCEKKIRRLKIKWAKREERLAAIQAYWVPASGKDPGASRSSP